jgi:hypothetical protein
MCRSDDDVGCTRGVRWTCAILPGNNHRAARVRFSLRFSFASGPVTVSASVSISEGGRPRRRPPTPILGSAFRLDSRLASRLTNAGLTTEHGRQRSRAVNHAAVGPALLSFPGVLSGTVGDVGPLSGDSKDAPRPVASTRRRRRKCRPRRRRTAGDGRLDCVDAVAPREPGRAGRRPPAGTDPPRNGSILPWPAPAPARLNSRRRSSSYKSRPVELSITSGAARSQPVLWSLHSSQEVPSDMAFSFRWRQAVLGVLLGRTRGVTPDVAPSGCSLLRARTLRALTQQPHRLAHR